MPIYRGLSGTNRMIKQQFRGLSGVNREIKEQYRGLSGVNRKVFSNGPTWTKVSGDGSPNLSVKPIHIDLPTTYDQSYYIVIQPSGVPYDFPFYTPYTIEYSVDSAAITFGYIGLASWSGGPSAQVASYVTAYNSTRATVSGTLTLGNANMFSLIIGAGETPSNWCSVTIYSLTVGGIKLI